MGASFVGHIVLLVLVTTVLALPHQKKTEDLDIHEAPSTTLAHNQQQSQGAASSELPGKPTKLNGKTLKPSHVQKDQGSGNGRRNVVSDVSASKRNPAVVLGAKALLSNPAIQEAVVEKGIDVAGKLVDKQLQIIDDAQEKAAEFLKKEIKLDITPDKGWESEDMFLPPGYHIDASVSGGEGSPKEAGEAPYTYPAGMGNVLMNGCWGTGYTETDPCYQAKWTSSVCQNMIDGAAFLGVGFDGRGKYSPESRKLSIVQRNCANKATYDGLDVPDTMNVHGIYDTSASLVTFEGRQEYQKHLQQEAGVSGSYFGFSAGVKEAWGESTQSSAQKYMAVMDIDVDRYEMFMDEVKPQDLSLSFLREFMNLPTSYFSAGGPLKYQNFIQRWGTHFIKSAKFGGQLEIRKTMDASEAGSIEEFEVKMELEYKTLFASVGARAASETRDESRKQAKTSSTSVVAHGGSQEIASILSDEYSPTLKPEFKEWLKTIPDYPKAFRFQMGSITDLLDFRANDLFSEETVKWGCEGNIANLQTEVKDGKTLKYYEVISGEGETKKQYCEFDSREALENHLQMRRTSLQRAIEIYMEEGPISISNIQLKACARNGDQPMNNGGASVIFGDTKTTPTWSKMTTGNATFRVSFDMLEDLPNSFRAALSVRRNMSRLVRFYKKKWFTSNEDGSFHLYSAFDNGQSSNTSKQKISILGLVLSFNEVDGSLFLSSNDYKASKGFFPTISKEMTGSELARVKIPSAQAFKRTGTPGTAPATTSATTSAPTSVTPCKVEWSNALRLDPTDSNGKCLHFTASTAGSIFVVFASVPASETSWYYVEISSDKVAIYKADELRTHTTNINACALGDASLYQSYFVCITESATSTLIEYGKTVGTTDSGDIYLNMVDHTDHITPRFYAFGNDENPANVMDAHVVSRERTKADCKGDTVRDLNLDLCVQSCHKDCDPLSGCKQPDDSTECYACRVALDDSDTCIPECPEESTLTSDKMCVPTYDAEAKVYFHDVPALEEMTLCVWVKLDDGWTGLSNQHFIKYQSSSLKTSIQVLLLNEVDVTMLCHILPNKGSADFSANQMFALNQLKDWKWHQICICWSGYNGVIQYYLDGRKLSSHSTQQRGKVDGGSSMIVGTDQHAVTEFQLWNRVLSEQEIAENAKKCNGGEGNVKQWYQGFEWVKAHYTADIEYNTPSICQAPEPKTEIPAPESNPGHLPVPGPAPLPFAARALDRAQEESQASGESP